MYCFTTCTHLYPDWDYLHTSSTKKFQLTLTCLVVDFLKNRCEEGWTLEKRIDAGLFLRDIGLNVEKLGDPFFKFQTRRPKQLMSILVPMIKDLKFTNNWIFTSKYTATKSETFWKTLQEDTHYKSVICIM